MALKTNQELSKIVSDTRANLRTERFSAAGARAKDPNARRKLRAMIARALTEQHSRSANSHQSIVK